MNYDNAYLSCQIQFVEPVSLNGVPRLTIQGTIKNKNAYSKIFLVAPNPPMTMTNYSGSGLPYPCANQAFENTPSYVDIHESVFHTTIFYPNSYYAVGGMEKIGPSILFGFVPQSSIKPTYVRLELPDRLPLRTLTHRSSRTGPEFYAKKAEIIGVPESQEALLRQIGEVKIKYGVA